MSNMLSCDNYPFLGLWRPNMPKKIVSKIIRNIFFFEKSYHLDYLGAREIWTFIRCFNISPPPQSGLLSKKIKDVTITLENLNESQKVIMENLGEKKDYISINDKFFTGNISL